MVVTARAQDKAYDFVSRFFAPAVGVDEDPVTGSAHCALAPYWAERLGKASLLAYQASRRGGLVPISGGVGLGIGGRSLWAGAIVGQAV